MGRLWASSLGNGFQESELWEGVRPGGTPSGTGLGPFLFLLPASWLTGEEPPSSAKMFLPHHGSDIMEPHEST